jgi:iron complex outermembrane recepter protein
MAANLRRVLLGSVACCASLGGASLSVAQAPEPTGPVYAVPQINVIGVTPVQGTGIERERVPANVITIDRNDIKQGDPLSPADILDLRAGNVSRVDSQNNPFQPNINVRGFTASPLLGEPQGLAIYQNGIRINEPFGDLVQWDLIPSFAINRMQVIQGTNPVFGLNALGGAITAEMNNGFNFRATSLSLEGGSFGRVQGTAEHGMQIGNMGFYVGLNGSREDGWRDLSPSRLFQTYFDGAYRGDNFELGAGLTVVGSDLTGNGPVPVELLAQDRSAIFTAPDNTKNTLVMLALRGNYDATDSLSFQSNGYFRYNTRNTLNGDDFDGEACEEPGNIGFLCAEEEGGEELLEDINGNPIPAALEGEAAVNRQRIITNGVGGSLQGTLDAPIFGLRNTLVVGGSFDVGWTEFQSTAELGEFENDRSVTGLGVFLGTEDFNTRLDARNIYYGLYISDTLAVTDRLNLTAAMRLNHAHLKLRDRFGDDLNGDHYYTRANPSFGATYQLAPALNLYGLYAEANRIPTAAELACADPEEPCRFPNAFVSDPPLKQVVSRSFEVGIRGRHSFGEGAGGLSWNLSAFRTNNQDDIIFVSAGPVVGSGFFQNAGKTRRVGVELGMQGATGPWSWYANYSYVRATFESELEILSPANPSADADGNIQVRPGDRIPSIPEHTVKLGLGYSITPRWNVAAESIISSDRFLRGDEGNDQSPIDGYAVFNLWSTYQITDMLQAKLRINNIFDAEYETFGVFADPTDVFPGFTNNRFVGPGAPLGVWAGITATF